MATEETGGFDNSAEDRIQITQEIIQELLVSLGDAWAEIEQLRQQQSQMRPRMSGRSGAGPPATGTLSVPSQSDQAEMRRGVLIIDDSRVLQMRLRSFIEPLGYSVLAVADGGAYGAEQAIRLRPWLVIVDHQMPDMNGLECVRAIRDQNRDSRIIVCSAYITDELSKDYAELGVTEILTKPIQLDQFVRAIHRAMGNLESEVLD